MACHAAIITETVAIWIKPMNESSVMTPSPVILETSLHVEGKHVKGPTASQSQGQLGSPSEAGIKQLPLLG